MRLRTVAPAACLALAAGIFAAPLAAQPPGPGDGSPFAGGVARGEVSAEPLPLSLADAIARGLESNLGGLLARREGEAADGARRAALARLLPQLRGSFLRNRQKINLAAFGIPVRPGEPQVVGPFDVIDLRLSLSQAVLDLPALRGEEAAAHRAAAGRYTAADARELVVVAVAGLYLAAVADESRIEAARAQVATAEALVRRAEDRKAAGTVPAIAVLRARVELASARQRQIIAENDAAKGRLALSRAIGVPPGQELELTDRVPFARLEGIGLDEALREARSGRADLKAAEERVRAAEAARRAAAAERAPSVHLDADYGAIGNTPGTSQGTFTLAARVAVPIFSGGRIHGEVVKADAQLTEARAQLSDLESRVEIEVRSALLDLRAAAEAVETAESGRELAGEQLAQAQDRFAAGVADNLEVVQAQEAVAAASESYISSLYSHNLAKAALARALGRAEQAATQLFRGNQP